MRICLIGLVLSFFSLNLLAKPVIVFDAGSSGTRMYIYEVNNGQATSLHSYKLKPGLSSLDPNDTDAFDQYFSNLVGSAEGVLNTEAKSQTPFHLYATAGVRTLPPAQQEALLNAARDALSNQAVTFGYPAPLDNDVIVINGSEEAGFIWVSDNYLNGNLSKKELKTRNTVVALEMGGASSEIAFLSQHAKDHIFAYKHKNVVYPIYSYGYDGLGADKAFASLYASGNPQFAACFPLGAPYPLDTAQITGTGDLETCVNAIKQQFVNPRALMTCQKATPGECSGFGVHQPAASNTDNYILTSAFYYLFNVLGIADQAVSYNNFTGKAVSFCSMTWDEVQTAYPKEQTSDLIKYCFTASLSKTLFDAWNVESKNKLKAVSSLNSVTVEWPLGAALVLGQ